MTDLDRRRSLLPAPLPLADAALALPRSVVATALGVGTALRGARVFHPHGSTHG